jgi:GMP synthase (glutamine-hydrolysing)
MIRTTVIDNSQGFLRVGPLLRRRFGEQAIVHDGIAAPPPALDSFDRLVISGSEASILANDDWILRQVDFVRDAIAAGKSILGICFGHQLIARALWGDAAVRRCAHPEFGWREVACEGDALFAGLPPRALLVLLHFDEVAALGPGARALATNADCAIQAFRLIDKAVWGVQFHPELHGGIVLFEWLMARRITPLARFSLARAVAGLRQVDWGNRILANFVEATK